MHEIEIGYVVKNLQKYKEAFNQLVSDHETLIEESYDKTKIVWDRLKSWDKRWAGSWVERPNFYKKTTVSGPNQIHTYDSVKIHLDKTSSGVTYKNLMESIGKHIQPFQALNEQIVTVFKVLRKDHSFADCLGTLDELEKFQWNDREGDMWHKLGMPVSVAFPMVPPHKQCQYDILFLQSFFLRMSDYIKFCRKFFHEVEVILETDIDIIKRMKVHIPAAPTYQYIAKARIDSLKALHPHPTFNLHKLIRVCEELNDNWAKKNYLSVAALNRVLLDHVPPIFGPTINSFNKVESNYSWGQSDKIIIEQLLKTSKNVSHLNLHNTITNSDEYPVEPGVNCHSNLERLLVKIIELLSKA